ncbi:hypothetical protein Tco_0086410 [Tanacetum coccineum]
MEQRVSCEVKEHIISYLSYFEEDDSGTRIELESHKENPRTINDDDDDENEKEKKDDKKGDDNDDDVNDDHTDLTLIKAQVMGSLETRNEKMQTPIPSPHRSPRTNLSSDKTRAYQESLSFFLENMNL